MTLEMVMLHVAAVVILCVAGAILRGLRIW